jgi:hypothetical protein
MKIFIFIAFWAVLSARANVHLEFNNPILSPSEAVIIFKQKAAEAEGASFEQHVLSVVAFSYTSQQWIIQFDCSTEHPKWKSENCGIYGYIQNNKQHKLLITRKL